MNLDMIPLISFVFVTTFTPGPNNISSASMGMRYGYRKTVAYLLGISSGFFVVMLACALLSNVLFSLFTFAERYLRWIGAGYIMWLAAGILRGNQDVAESEPVAAAYAKGFFLQLVNPKVAVYGLTLFSTFLAAVSGRVESIAAAAAILSLTAFAAMSMWTLCGAAIRIKLKRDSFKLAVNTALALLLMYTAVTLSGAMAWF